MSDGIDFSIEKTLVGRGGSFSFRAKGSFARGAVSGCSGPSGSGKTTLLRVLAGLERPDAGLIRSGGRAWFSSSGGCWRPAWKRSAALVFQDYPLFPHLSLMGNLRYAASDAAAPDEALELVGLGALRDRRPRELSGGQRQRAALALALASDPEVLLLDEPFNALDGELRARLTECLGVLLAARGITTVLVSHQESDLERLCDSVRSMDQLRSAYDAEAALREAGSVPVPGLAPRMRPWHAARA